MHRWFLIRLLPALVGVGLGASQLSCIDVQVPPPKSAKELVAKDLKVSEGTKVDMACTPSGVEICFDAKDNNCNGVLDEGCGVHTGVLQFMIAWNEPSADVDLRVTDTSGEEARIDETTGDGLRKDRDCPRSGECYGQNIENVYLETGEPKRGKYKVLVRLEDLSDAQPPVRVQLGVRIGPRTLSTTLELSPIAGSSEKTLEFSL